MVKKAVEKRVVDCYTSDRWLEKDLKKKIRVLERLLKTGCFTNADKYSFITCLTRSGVRNIFFFSLQY